jgi:hypothetical protein
VITFTIPEYIYLVSLQVQASTSLKKSRISFGGDVNVLIRDIVDIGNYCSFNPEDYKVLCYIGEASGPVTGDFKISDEGNVFNASVFLPRGALKTVGQASSGSPPTLMSGKFIADKIVSDGKNITWKWRSCETGLPAKPGFDPSLSNGFESQQSNGSSFTVYPVPNEGRFNVSIEYPKEEKFRIQVINTLGLKVYESEEILVKGTARHTIDLQPASPGIYIVVFESRDEHVIRKIVVR